MTLVHVIVQYIAELFGDTCSLRLLSADGQFLDLVALHHPNPEALAFLQQLLKGTRLRVGDTPAGQAVASGESVLVPVVPPTAIPVSIPPHLLPYAEKFGFCSLLAVPLRRGKTTLGSLAISRGSPGRAYTLADQSVLEALAARAAMALEHERLHDELQAALAAREEFLSIAAHELKTPLTSLLLQLQVGERAAAKDPATNMTDRFAKAIRSGRRLEGLINQLLDVSRIEAGRLSLEAEPLNLAGLVREVVARFVEASPPADIAIASESEINGLWDRQRLDQVITNLLSNAVKYGRSNPITVALCVEGNDAVLRVTDHGIGIDEEHQKKVFQRFERAVAAREFGGFGLGLWIAKTIVEASGGTIGVESTLGEGSTFTVRLPLEREYPAVE